MKKTLYSLMLSDEVVQAVDVLAHRMGISRSALVNRILAEYVSIPTAEQQINQIFQALEELVAPSENLVPFFTPNSPIMSMKSSLTYKYRPTVKYEVDLNGRGETMGELSVVFRTQSSELIRAMTAFFRLWVEIESAWLPQRLGRTLEYALYEGKFVRPIALPQTRNCTAEEIAGAISDYVQLFDRMLKGWLGGGLSARDIEDSYRRDLEHRTLLI